MFEATNDNELNNGCAKIRVVGVGGGGCNAVNTMIQAGLTGVEYIVANTDMQALNANLAPTKIQLGVEITKGLGAGANPEIGRKAALDEYEKLTEILKDSDMVFITAGMGGGTGTGAAPVIAKLAKELGALTVGVVTKPFMFEGKKRTRIADEGIVTLEQSVDSLITIPNQRLLSIAGESLSLIETFKKADEVLLNAVRGISDLINHTGFINADFADVSTVMINKGMALMGTGVCTGDNRAIRAANEAICSPLLEDITIDGATGIIINITGSSTLSMHETNEAVTLIMDAADEDAMIIFGTVIDDNLGEDIKVTVIATGLGGQERVPALSIPNEEIVYTKETSIDTLGPYIEIDEKENTREIEVALTPEVIVKEEAPKEVPNRSRLVDSIKEAATRYEQSKSGETVSVEEQATKSRSIRQNSIASNDLKGNQNRAKSIAEKLGFINFDEDELDTPTFLRKEDSSRQHGDGQSLSVD